MAMKALNKGSSDETRIRLENVGDTLEGYYVGTDSFDYKGDTLTKQLFQNDDGDTISIIGSKTLNEDLAEVAKGIRVRITYGGKATSKNGRKYHKYAVEFDDEDRREV
jgi:hypothetical protein